MRVVLVPPSTALVNAWKNQHVPVGLLLLAELVRREPGLAPSIWDGPLAFADEAEAEAAARTLLGLDPTDATTSRARARTVISRPGEATAGAPTVVGFSAWCHTLPAQTTLAAAIKRVDPTAWVVFGGPQATATDGALLAAFPFIDAVLGGEAEESFVEWLRCVRDGRAPDAVAGLTRRGAEGAVVRNPPPPPRFDLDTLPTPAHDLAPPSPVATVESGRGCPWACKFCSTSAFFARRHRARGVESLLAELWALHRRGVHHVTFTDDIFTVDRKAVRAFCEALLRRGPPLRWGCSTRIDCVDADLLRLMAAARCDGILYGVETGSAALQRRMGKRLDVARVVPTVQLTAQAGIVPYCTFIFGFPDESPADLAETLALVRRLAASGVRVTAQTLAILPDTPYHRSHGAALRWDGFTSLSRARLSPAEVARVRAHPDLFSSFYYLESEAAPRLELVAAALFTNLLRQFPRTAAAADFGEGVDPFAHLRALLAEPTRAASVAEPAQPATVAETVLGGDFDPLGLEVLERAVAEAVRAHASVGGAAAAAALEAEFALEAAALGVRTRWMNQGAERPAPAGWVRPAPGVFVHRPQSALARVVDDARVRLEPVPAELAAAVAGLPGEGAPEAWAAAAFAEHLGPLLGPVHLAGLVSAGWLEVGRAP